MGLIQRIIETAGIPSISVSLSLDISRKVRPPRALYPGLPLGHPLGYPNQAFHQLQILRLLLKYLAEIKTPGTIIEKDLTIKTGTPLECVACVM